MTIRNSSLQGNGSAFYGGISNSGDLVVRNSVIQGNGGGNGAHAAGEDGGGGIRNTGTALVENTLISDNRLDSGGWGAGILNFGTLTVLNSTLARNSISGDSPASGSMRGGGLYNGGQATLINSTVSGNVSDDPPFNTAMGGGIFNVGTLVLRNDTIFGNAATYYGGLLNQGTASMSNSILAGNTNTSGPAPDCSGTITTQGYNLVQNMSDCTLAGGAAGDITGDPLLGPLQNNGGPTPTHALLAGSPAIDAGNPARPGSSATACATRDQRGVRRPRDGNHDRIPRCDMGSYELGGRRGAPEPPEDDD
jgi:hypothetical protein